jgi:hypothetical protein
VDFRRKISEIARRWPTAMLALELALTLAWIVTLIWMFVHFVVRFAF